MHAFFYKEKPCCTRERRKQQQIIMGKASKAKTAAAAKNVTKPASEKKENPESDSISISKDDSNKNNFKCGVHDCPVPAVSRCGGCQKVGYCSKEHQKLHWKDHKGDCCGWKVSENKRLGRFLIAVRDVKPGEIIMQEKPLIITPPKITLPVCLGCYSEFKPDGVVTDGMQF